MDEYVRDAYPLYIFYNMQEYIHYAFPLKVCDKKHGIFFLDYSEQINCVSLWEFKLTIALGTV